MKYKIGRYCFKEITEEEYCKMFDDKDISVFSLIDYDGEAVKYFKKVSKGETEK